MKWLKWLTAAVVVAALAFAAVTFAEAEPPNRYRTAIARTGDVTQTVTVSGAVDHVNRADVTFGTEGTIADLTVSPGDAVTAGQELGRLDTTALAAAVDRAEADLAAAEDAAEQEAEQADEEQERTDGLAAAQQAVAAAMKTSGEALTAQEKACAEPGSAACAAAVTATRDAQNAVQQAQSALQAALQSDKTPPANPAMSVDEATATLVEAQQALDGATLTSPIAGTVGSVSAAAGDRASAGQAVVTVIGAGAAEVTANVPLEQLKKLTVGQDATVTPVGTTTEVPGTVTKVGTLPDDSAETVAYPVTITVAEPPAALAAGSTATAAVTVATAKDVLTVPTSAVRRGMVQVLTGDQATPTLVTVGAVGGVRTEIKGGLAAGDQVVLADLDTPVPSGDLPSGPRGPMMSGGGPPMIARSGK